MRECVIADVSQYSEYCHSHKCDASLCHFDELIDEKGIIKLGAVEEFKLEFEDADGR